MSDTIFALSSGPPPAAIAVVRVSGPRAGDAMRALARRLPEPRQAMLARLRDPGDHAAIDDALVLWFPGPRSETGEDLAEFQLHGGRAVVAAMLRVLARMPELRLAEPGEFARRSFANGKLDLTRAEALADLIGADTDAQRRQALRQLNGLLADQAETWRGRLIEAMALIEASIDFPDEAVPATLMAPALAIAGAMKGEIDRLLADEHRGERLRDGLRIAVAGPVNVGKSSIVNLIAKRPAAIVSPYAGTTRDVIEVHLDLGGYPITIVDTAGLRDSDDPVEQEGIRRARQNAGEADLVLWVVDASDPDPPAPPRLTADEHRPPLWIIANKSDLIEPLSFGSDRRCGGWATANHRGASLRSAGSLPHLGAHRRYRRCAAHGNGAVCGERFRQGRVGNDHPGTASRRARLLCPVA